uniref:C3H1-type domain-containing protein n=1 Tax=Echinostoma caproni TaxID=27848 RepID=A0A183ARH4_9TREM
LTSERPTGLPQVPARPTQTQSGRTSQNPGSGVPAPAIHALATGGGGGGGAIPPGFRIHPPATNADPSESRIIEDAITRRVVRPTASCDPSPQATVTNAPDSSAQPQQLESDMMNIKKMSSVKELSESTDSSVPPTIVVPPASDTTSPKAPIQSESVANQSRQTELTGSCPNLAGATRFKLGTKNKHTGLKTQAAAPVVTKASATENEQTAKPSEAVTTIAAKMHATDPASNVKDAAPPKTDAPTNVQPPRTDDTRPIEQTRKLAPLRRQRHGMEHLYTLQGQAVTPLLVAPINSKPQPHAAAPAPSERPVCPPRPQPKVEPPSTQKQQPQASQELQKQVQQHQLLPQPQQLRQTPVPQPTWTTGPAAPTGVEHVNTATVVPSTATVPTTTTTTTQPVQSVPPQSQTQMLPSNAVSGPTGATIAPVSAGSVIGGSGPASFFTSQMTAFKVWLQTADEKQPPATQLPILLQILLSQSHRIRAMQLLSEFLDLGPWAVTHCLTVGILPYIVRLFHSPVAEVKPHLVFIWGKIIATAQTEFGRNDSVRDFGYKYFITCLSDTENLVPLTRTITAFALAKMLEKEPNGESDAFFQDVYLKQNFIPLVLSQLDENPPYLDVEIYVRLRLWLIFALAKVRAATVYALGTLIANQTVDASKQDHADQISHQVGARLARVAYLDASWLVRCELVVAFAGLARQFEVQLCAMAMCSAQEWNDGCSPAPTTVSHIPVGSGRPARHSVSVCQLLDFNGEAYQAS